MVKVRKANVVLRVPDAEIQKYVDNGYDVYNAQGVVVQAATPSDINELKKAYVQHINEIKALKNTIEQLKVQVADKKQPKKNASKKATED